MVTRQLIRLPVTISMLVVTSGSAGGISAEKSGLEFGPCSTRTRGEGSSCGS